MTQQCRQFSHDTVPLTSTLAQFLRVQCLHYLDTPPHQFYWEVNCKKDPAEIRKLTIAIPSPFPTFSILLYPLSLVSILSFSLYLLSLFHFLSIFLHLHPSFPFPLYLIHLLFFLSLFLYLKSLFSSFFRFSFFFNPSLVLSFAFPFSLIPL